MLNWSNLLQLGVICATLFTSSVITDKFLVTQNFWLASQPRRNVASLPNGNYQFCSQPDPKDWRDGAGVCFNFSKNQNRVHGYYGYPHSDQFICVRGVVDGDRHSITGEGLGIVWDNLQLKHTPKSLEFKWDLEGHLTLSPGNILNTTNTGEDGARWIFHRKALLNLRGFYRYDHPRMTPVSQLCDWSLIN